MILLDYELQIMDGLEPSRLNLEIDIIDIAHKSDKEILELIIEYLKEFHDNRYEFMDFNNEYYEDMAIVFNDTAFISAILDSVAYVSFEAKNID